MNDDLDSSESSSGRFLQTVRPLRDLESNWTVDLAKNLEEYLLKVCSGQISGEDAKLSVNFAEAALLLQGSVQVYSRKVEYLYSLVLHALDFISKKSEEDQEAGPSDRRNSTGAHSAKEEGDDPFWGLDDIPVDAKSLLDNATCRDVPPSHFVRPPANIVVLEGECLDAGGDAGGELESYLLATCDLYRDFILLDSCDAIAVDNFLDSKAGKGPSNVYGISSVTSKGRKSFQSPSRRSGGTAQKLSAKKKNDANPFQSPCVDKRFESNDCNIGHTPPACDFANHDDGFGTGDAYSEPGDFDDSDDDNDPWKPLNPHEPGNLKVKPYKRVKGKTRLNVGSQKHPSLTAEFPLAKLDSLVSPELNGIWGAKLHASENLGRSESLTLYEKLRQSLVMGEKRTKDTCNPENNTEDNGYEGNGYESGDPDTGPSYFDMPDKTFNHEDEPPHQEKENPDAHANLEDLCRSHLDSLLETLAENEKQTELATRVSSWKQRIEQNLEEQDARPPFDIHVYGERVLDKLSTEGYGGNALSFGDVVKGQKKHDVARTFSALLQLVNNGDVDLVRGSQASASTCHSDENSFHLRLLKNERKKGILLQSCKKRAKSPLVKNKAKIKNKGKENCVVSDSSPQAQAYSSSYRFSISIGKSNSARCTPEGKKRRKSRVVAPLDINFVG
ncbi:condensin-2 complex subunit H2 [Salvia miltiorrhiza]|uniref:condensin-2 complex subunit H2 n=1 Tax=Salvia miltiorrhiza TaxID=226208 RepID=UPI0025AD38AC|nr:condensin-2 complex subunit H2 [Salvia miltiorrhiza]